MRQTVGAFTPSANPPSTAWQEADEQTRFEGFAREIMAWQKQDAPKDDGLPRRGFHAKIHAGLMAEFHVLPGLPEHARHGVFSSPKIFPALVRFSNGDSVAHADRTHEPRGIAIKLVGVPGRKLLPGLEDAVTQDFLATSHSVTSAVRSVDQFMDFIRVKRDGLKFGSLVRALGLGEACRILWALFIHVRLPKVRSMVTEQFSSTAPIKFGPYAVKFMVRLPEKTTGTTSPSSSDDFLHDDLARRLRQADIVLDFLVQFYVDDKSTPIEDTSVRWNTAFLKVAELHIPKCDPDSAHGKALSEAVNRLSFSPWHATEDHRPLGNVMRARRVAYEASSALRNHAPEPTSLPLAGL
jgi:hypothetical protein